MTIFKDTINATTLKNYGAKLSEIKGNDAIQVLQRDSEVKVVITQDYFFRLLTLANLGDLKQSSDSSVGAELDETVKEGLEVLREHRKIISKHD